MRRLLASAVFFSLMGCGMAGTRNAQAQSLLEGSAKIVAFSHVTSATALADGMELRDGALVMQITALRDDVIRVRAGRDGQLPENASWAVLADARAASVSVTPDDSAVSVGFRTHSLQVSIGRETGLLTVRDASGNVLREDQAPLQFAENGSFRLTEAMPVDEHYFGLGDKTGPSDRRNHAYTMWNTDAYRFQEGTDPLYKSIPFFISFRAGVAMGTLLDNTWRTSFDFGKESPKYYSFGAVDGPVDYYLMYGPSPDEVVETYAWLTGKPPLPPRWMFGFQQSRYSYMNQQQLVAVADRLRADRIPADGLYLDIDFQDRNRPFTVNTKAFPDMASTLAKLKAMQFHVVAITDLHIADAPNQGYAPYDTGIAGNDFVHLPNGKVYVGDVWPGPAVFPDFTVAAARAWWGTLYKPFVKLGFAGFWNDMNEPSVFNGPEGTMPLDVVHRIQEPGFISRNATHAEIHNVFGMENARATYDGLLAIDPNERPFVLTRATYAGGQRYAATWTGDDSSTWNHLRMATPMLKSLGMCGFSFAGADVGGFAGTPPADLLTKWIEVGAFQPYDRDHTEKGTGPQEPWIGGVAAEDIRRHYIGTRYRLMPYLYTVAEESSRTGLPMMRALFLDYPDAAKDGHPIDVDPGIDAEFLLGHDLLIAPSPYPEEPDTYTVEFPTAIWYDFWTGARVPPRPAATMTEQSTNAPASPADLVPLATSVTPQLAELPVYVRGGAILPMAPLTQSTDETPSGPLTLRVYVGDDCRGTVYTDDGKTFDYKHGQYLREDFSCSVSGGALTLVLGKREGSYPAWWKNVRVEVYGWRGAANHAALGEGQTIEESPIANGLALTAPDDGGGETIRLN